MKKIYLCALLSACAASEAPKKQPIAAYVQPKPSPDQAQDTSAPRVMIRGGTVMTAAGQIYAPGFVVMERGVIVEVGPGEGPAEAKATVIDAKDKFVTPGIIDTHSHMGVYPMPYVDAHEDGNEMVRPTTPEVWAEHAFWPQDPGLSRALNSGVTTIQVLPGSGNLIGGRSFVAKLRPQNSARAMRFVGAPQGLKMACGENPKRIYGEKGGPMTRMGNVFGYREAFQKAVEYRRQWQHYERDLAEWKNAGGSDGGEAPPEPPSRDLGMETLVGVLDGKILVQNHCYRADEMHIMLDVAKEFGFHIRSFHHALEAYKLRHRLAEEHVAVSTWADWWGFKMEAVDGIPQNASMVAAAGARAIIHSDSPTEIRQLNQEAAKARTAGQKVGIHLDDDTVLRWFTENPAWALGIDDKVGTLEKNKMADVVIWTKHPLSVYALAEKVFIDGHLVFDRTDKNVQPESDFEVGLAQQQAGVQP